MRRLVLICMYALSGLATAAAPGFPTTITETLEPVPPVGTTTTRRVGENLLEYFGTRTEVTHIPADSIILQSPAGSTWGFLEGRRRIVAKAGTLAPFRTWGSTGLPMICIDGYSRSTDDTAATTGCFVDSKNSGVFDISVFPTHNKRFNMDAPTPYVRTTEESSTSVSTHFVPSLRRELIYQGVSKGELRISYREFKDNIARPAFSQDLTYEISADGTSVITFKEIKLNVISANREALTYVVEEPRSLPYDSSR